MKRYANVVVELSKAAAVLLVLRTAEVVFSSITEDTQSESVLFCKQTIIKKPYLRQQHYSGMPNDIARKAAKAVFVT